MASFEISDASVSAAYEDQNPWPNNPLNVVVYPRKKYSARVGMYLPAKLQRAHDKRKHLMLKLDRKGEGPIRAENKNFLKFAQEYMDQFWKRSKFKTIKAIRKWLWDVWTKGETHATCVALVKSYKNNVRRNNVHKSAQVPVSKKKKI